MIAPRSAFTMLETLIAISILGIVSVLVAQLSTQALAERTRADERLCAIETAENVLESARALKWANLSPEWAAGQRLSDDTIERLRDASLSVRVEPEVKRPRVKRVEVEINWKQPNGKPTRPVALTAFFADRGSGDES